MNTLIPNVNTDSLNALIFKDGHSVIAFFEDPGHGWLKVPKDYIKQLGIESKISGFSYVEDDDIYLEEDCDMSIFLKETGILDSGYIKIFFGLCPKVYQEITPIRNMRRYKPPTPKVQKELF